MSVSAAGFLVPCSRALSAPSPWCGPPLHNRRAIARLYYPTGGVVVSGLFLPLLQNLEIVIELGRGQSAAESRSSKK